ncbi:uncharacterized protein LOC123808459 [Phyllostomus hastatus]|uniref:uncharacterized protein LOC123808459 n=1 Tax=Phyllostomus hastatus TaxID=9423 RepID=UPI001E6803B1|nr:uncharacterized protein LOC123808459 [Phyllostomus hastatus]XP_045679065.1 uncharacterized protein LOC123808459 [Phyllostomus hastatus]
MVQPDAWEMYGHPWRCRFREWVCDFFQCRGRCPRPGESRCSSPWGSPWYRRRSAEWGGWLYVPSPLPRGLRWWPEHPLEALGIQDPLGKSVAGKPDAKRPAGRGGVRQARPWGRSVGLSARPQVSSGPASEDAASCSDSSSLLGLELVGDWVSRAAMGRGSRPAPPTADEASREPRSGPEHGRAGRGGGVELSANPSAFVQQCVDGALRSRNPELRRSPSRSLASGPPRPSVSPHS